MSANVETMMYVREKPWHGLGTQVEEAPTSADALRLAGLDWEVVQENVFDQNGVAIPDYKANVRSTDRHILGVVGNRYRIIQNSDAFDFTDDLIGGEVHYETAGSLREGRQIWLLAKMEGRTIAGDELDPYLCFTNSHDGTSGVRVCMTPIRVVCQNTLNMALSAAKRSWGVRHTESIHEHLEEARDCLFRANLYLEHLSEYADAAARKPVSDEELKAILSELFPVTEKSTDLEKANRKRCQDEFMICYFAPDIAKFRGTAWGVINAARDLATHTLPHRNTKNYAANNFSRVLDGHALIDKAAALSMGVAV